MGSAGIDCLSQVPTSEPQARAPRSAGALVAGLLLVVLLQVGCSDIPGLCAQTGGCVVLPLPARFERDVPVPGGTVRVGLVEVEGGIARFFVVGAPWADLEVESDTISRLTRMLHAGGHNEYPIHGLTPGDAIDFRFRVGTGISPGQVWSDWFQHVYVGRNAEPATGSTPRVRPLAGGRLSFEVDDVPWAELHREEAGVVRGRRLGVDGNRHALTLDGLVNGELVVYRWVIGIDQVPGQYDTDWTTLVYEDPSVATAPAPAAGSEPPQPAEADDWILVWGDEFDSPAGESPDASRWVFDLGGSGWGNAERQYYTDRPENASMDGEGHLVIAAREESLPGTSCWYGTCRYSSARLKTQGRFEQQYGRIEMRAQLPFGPGLWPAFWMLGAELGSVGWPAAGEIDVMENIGREPSEVHGTVHGPGYSGAGGIGSGFRLPEGERFADAFHTFAIEWAPESVRWFVDGHLYQTLTPANLPPDAPWVFDQPFFLLLNVAVGGYWPGDPDATTAFPQHLRVDYVRVFERQESPPGTTREGSRRIEAEDFDAQWGVLTERVSSASGGANIGWVARGDWSVYRDVDFGNREVESAALRVASGAGVSGEVAVRLDSVSGPRLAVFPLEDTGGWEDWVRLERPLETLPDGRRDVYLVFDSAAGRRELGNVDWLEFGLAPIAEPVPPEGVVPPAAPAAIPETGSEAPSDPSGASEQPVASPPATQAPGPVASAKLEETQRSLYLLSGASSGGVGVLSPTPGSAGSFDRIPGDGSPIAWEARDLVAPYVPRLGGTRLELWLDGVQTPGIYAQARVLYDFEGDGTPDRVETFVAAPAHDHVGLDLYDSEAFPLVAEQGVFADLDGGTVRLELRDPHFLDGPEVRVGASLREHQVSKVDVPFELNVAEFTAVSVTPEANAFHPAIVCAGPAVDPRCGPAFDPGRALTERELEAALENGLEAFRLAGAHGACAACHSPDAFDLAVIGYSDADIRRRALEHVSQTRAEEIVQLVHAQRQQHDLREVLHPAEFRPLQPGFVPLPGLRPADRDLAFLQHLRDEVGLLLVTDVIDSREKAEAAEEQLRGIDLGELRIGVRLDRWSEDAFHGPSHTGQDLTDPSGTRGHAASVAEWLPNLGVAPQSEHADAYYALFDAYAADPSDLNFWRFYAAIRELTESEERLDGEAERRAYEWMLTKYESVQIMSHMLRKRTRDYPDRVVDRFGHDEIADVEIAIRRNPFWRVGDLIRQRPLHCNHPDGCTVFPDFVPVEADLWKQEVQSRVLQRAWFWAGWVTDPALLTSDDSFPTISGDYFYPLHHGPFPGHYAFILAKLSTEKANATGWEVSGGAGTAGHGKWASIRPFLVYKHSEFQRPQLSEADPRHALYYRLMANVARMWIYLVDADLEATGEAFDRAGTAKAVNFARLNWLDSVEPGGPRAEIYGVFDAIVEKLRTAKELRQQHHTYDLYDYLPVADVDVD